MLAKITAPDLPQDPIEAKLLIDRHNEYKIEIDRKNPEFQNFYSDGDKIVQAKNTFSDEVKDKINLLQNRIALLSNIWAERSIIYDQNLDIVIFKRDANALDNWLAMREGTLKENTEGDNILHVEDLISKHRDFEETIKAQEDKFENLKRKTKLENAFAQQLERESRARKAEKERQEQERLEARKRVEMQNIAEKRKQENFNNTPKQDVVQEKVNGNHSSHYIPAIDPRPTNVNIRKTNSINTYDREKVRRGSSEHAVKRAESMRVNPVGKPPKRTPSFTTRRRGSKVTENLPTRLAENIAQPIHGEVEGFLERKHLLMAGGKKASNRQWKNFFTVLCGQLLCFFKSKEEFLTKLTACPPINIHNAETSVADDYHKRKYTFRLRVVDGSEYLFACTSQEEMHDWINKINFRAHLDPKNQLVHFDIPKVSNVSN